MGKCKAGEVLKDNDIINSTDIDDNFICGKCKATIRLLGARTVCDRCHTIYNVIPSTYIISTYSI